jgi:hypothetical protein
MQGMDMTRGDRGSCYITAHNVGGKEAARGQRPAVANHGQAKADLASPTRQRSQAHDIGWPCGVTVRTETGSRGMCSCTMIKARIKTNLSNLKPNHLHYAQEGT